MNKRDAQARLNDPDSHFPYKLDHALTVLDVDAPAGPEGPDDDRARVSDYISEDIIRLSDAMIKAQSEYLASQTEDARVRYVQAQATLVEARKEHRSNRGSVPNVVAVRSPL